MKIFCADETFVRAAEAQQVGVGIYGGLVLKEKTFHRLSRFTYDLKRRFVVPQAIELKWGFENVWREMAAIGHLPSGATRKTEPTLYQSLRSDYNLLKETVLSEVSQSDAQIIIAIRPNTLLKASHSQGITYPVEAIARKFEKIRFIRQVCT